MNHIDTRLTAWLGESLDRAAREEIEAHCADCEDCRRLLARSEAVWSALGELTAPAPDRPAWEGIVAVLHPSRERTGVRDWRRWSFPAAAAAALVCGVVLGDRLAGEPTGVARILTQDIIAGTLLSEDAASDLDGLIATAWYDPAQRGTR